MPQKKQQLIRGKSNLRPLVVEARDRSGQRLHRLENKPLNRKTLHRYDVDLVVSFQRGRETFTERMVLLYRQGTRRKKEYQRLHTNLKVPISLIDTLYRYRWQIEICMKELKSFTGLRKYSTGKANIVEALIFATFLASVLRRFILNKAEAKSRHSLSFLKAAGRSAIYFSELVTNIIYADTLELLRFLQWLVAFLTGNARRSNPERDKRKGSLKLPLNTAQKA